MITPPFTSTALSRLFDFCKKMLKIVRFVSWRVAEIGLP